MLRQRQRGMATAADADETNPAPPRLGRPLALGRSRPCRARVPPRGLRGPDQREGACGPRAASRDEGEGRPMRWKGGAGEQGNGEWHGELGVPRVGGGDWRD